MQSMFVHDVMPLIQAITRSDLCHSTVLAIPSGNSTFGSQSSNHLALEMFKALDLGPSGLSRRCAINVDFQPTTRKMISAVRSIVYLSSVPRLIGMPTVIFSEARIEPFTMSST